MLISTDMRPSSLRTDDAGDSLLAAAFDRAESPEWKCQLIPAHQRNTLEQLLSTGRVTLVSDTIELQLGELIETRHPAQDLSAQQIKTLMSEHLGGTRLSDYGQWAFYPWSQRLVHVLPESEYRELRTSRNRNKITLDEQLQLRDKRVGVVGLSVGQATALTLAMEEVGGTFVLADFDNLSLSNMNRLRTGVHNIGVNKAVLAAREIFELNPFARIELFAQGINEENLDLFLGAEQAPLDVLFEECDDFQLKVLIRQRARALRIPVVMETSDRGMLDVERFDIEPTRPLLHGILEGIALSKTKVESSLDKIPLGLDLVGGVNASARLLASALEVKTTLKTWPQLASAVALGGATSTDVGRRILLGQFRGSGRFYVDVEHLVADGTNTEVTPSLEGKGVSAAATEKPSVAVVERSGVLDEAQSRTLVTYGAMAPSGGNSQPWRFVFKDAQLQCFHEPDRSKAFLDYQNFASYISFGAVVENMSLVAQQQGLSPHVEIFPQPSQPTHVCTLSFSPLTGPAQDTELFHQIPKRVTNRKPGQRTPLSVADRSAFQSAIERQGGQLHLLETPTQLQAVANILGPADRLRFLSRVMHQELLKEIRWTPKEVESTRDGLDVATLELSAVDLAGLRLASSLGAMELVAKLGGGRALEKPTRAAVAHSSVVGLVSMPGGNTPKTMFEGGRAVQRLWLTATAHGYAFQPMTSLICLFWRLVDGAEDLSRAEVTALSDLRQAFLALFDIPQGHGEVMLFRLTQADAPTAHSLRRPIDEMFETR